MKLDVQVCGHPVAKLYRERDEYLLAYLAQTDPADFISLTMPVRDEPWRWPRDLHPFFRQNLPEGYLLSVIREEFGPLLDGTDLSLLAVVGGMGIGRVTVTPEGSEPGAVMDPLHIEHLLKADNTADHFARLVRRYARAAISGMVPKFLAPQDRPQPPLGKPTLRTSRHIIKDSDDSTALKMPAGCWACRRTKNTPPPPSACSTPPAPICPPPIRGRNWSASAGIY